MAEAEHFNSDPSLLFTDLKEANKKSSITFGREEVNYKSVAHESMEYKGNFTYIHMIRFSCFISID